MQLIANGTQGPATIPTKATPVGTPGYANSGEPGTFTASDADPDVWNTVLAELANVVLAAGLLLDPNNNAQVLAALQLLGRIRLTANLNIYVATTGSDTANNGLSSGAPFATLQKAWNTIVQNYDLAGFTATVNVANGTYAGEVFCTSPPVGVTGSIRNEPTQPAPNVIFQGNAASPSSVVIDVTAGNCFHVGGGAQITINGFTLLAGGSSSSYNTEGTALYAFANGGIQFQNIIFGTCSNAHIQSTAGSTIESLGNPYTITGGANAHAASSSSGYLAIASSTVILTGTPNFTNGFAFPALTGVVNVSGMTFVGSATGPYFTTDTNGVLESNGVITSLSTTYLPGNANGIQSRGGQFN